MLYVQVYMYRIFRVNANLIMGVIKDLVYDTVVYSGTSGMASSGAGFSTLTSLFTLVL